MDPIGVFGAFAGAAGLLIQVQKGIEWIDRARTAVGNLPQEIDDLVSDLRFLSKCLQKASVNLGHRHDFFVSDCERSCLNVTRDLSKLQKTVGSRTDSELKLKWRLWLSHSKWKEDVADLQRSIQGAKMTISIMNQDMNGRQTRQLLQEVRIVQQLLQPGPADSTQDSVLPSSAAHEAGPIIAEPEHYRPSSRLRRPRQINCLINTCSCSCHSAATLSSRFWALEYSPWSIQCDSPFCTASKFGMSFRVALSRWGFRWAVVLQCHILTESGKASIRPVMEVERIVPYTAPGFVILAQCQENDISADEACSELRKLYRADPTFKNHVDPSGQSYIESLVSYWHPLYQEGRRQLLSLFLREFRMDRGCEKSSFLVKCVRHIGETDHLSLLEDLLHFGFDPALCGEPLRGHWPTPSSPNWRSEARTPDPFFHQYLRHLCRDNPGFVQMTPLHEAVLLGSDESVAKYVARAAPDQKNFIGQTPLHLAMERPSKVKILLGARHDPNCTDAYGMTPLMYAAGLNNIDAAKLLFEAGADVHTTEDAHGRDFLGIASAHEHWEFLSDVLCYVDSRLQSSKDRRAIVGRLGRHIATCFALRNHSDRNAKGFFSRFLDKCDTVNFLIDCSNCQGLCTLAHHVQSLTELEALLTRGFNLLNQGNGRGQSPLIRQILPSNVALVQRLIEAGSDIQLKDNTHHGALCYALGQLRRQVSVDPFSLLRKDTSSSPNILRTLLDSIRDNPTITLDGKSCGCKCRCTSKGCESIDGLEARLADAHSGAGHVWASFEWLHLLRDHDCQEEATQALLALIRRNIFHDWGMTHVSRCRYPQRHWAYSVLFEPKRLQDEDIDDILEEESELIVALEAEMHSLAGIEFDALLHIWLSQWQTEAANLPDDSSSTVSLEPASLPPQQKNPKRIQVDYQNDRLIYGPTVCVSNLATQSRHQVLRQTEKGIKRYVLWIVKQFRNADVSQEGALRRLNWLQKALSALDIPCERIPKAISSLKSEFELSESETLSWQKLCDEVYRLWNLVSHLPD